MSEDKILTPHEALEKQKEILEKDVQEPKLEEVLAEQNVVLAQSLVSAVEKCDDARQFGAVARLAVSTGQVVMAVELLDIMIARIDSIMGGHYDDVEDKDLVDIVGEKMKQPPQE